MRLAQNVRVRIDQFAFGSIRIDGVTYDHDVVIDNGAVSKRRKGPSKRLREEYGHTPLTLAENIPWECDRLVIGTGANAGLPVADEVLQAAKGLRVEVVMVPTIEAAHVLCGDTKRTNAILHVTC